jgi:excisionase family DNA binding protein
VETQKRKENMDANNSEILTGQEAMGLLKISRSTLWKLTKENEIPAYRVGNGKTSNLRYKRSELLDWLEKNRVGRQEQG